MLRRMGFSLLAIMAVAIGLVVGTFNSESVLLDLLWFQVNWPLGLILLCAFVVGLVLGMALVNMALVLPLRLRLRRLRIAGEKRNIPDYSADDA